MSRKWTDTDISKLQVLAGKLSLPEISRALERTERAILFKASELSISLRHQKKTWTDEEIQELRVLRSSGDLSWAQVSEKIGRSSVACRKMWQRLEGKKSDLKALEFYAGLQKLLDKRGVDASTKADILKYAKDKL